MVDYLDWKDKSGLDEIGVKGIAERKSVHLPNGLELSSADTVGLSCGAPDFVSFLSKYFSKQLKETHQLAVHVKHEAARGSTRTLSIPIQKKTSAMIRDQYVSQVHDLFKVQERKKTSDQRLEGCKPTRNANLVKFAYGVHATPSLSLDFIKPSLRGRESLNTIII